MSKKTIETKTFSFEAKQFDDAAGTFEGYLSVFDVTDRGGDIVRPGAFRKTLTERKRFPLRYEHEYTIGYLEGYEDSVGLKVKGQIVLDIQKGRDAYALMKADSSLLAMSIGYNVIDSADMKRGEEYVRELKELRLLEGSLVTIPMNPEAVVTSVKSLEAASIVEALRNNPELADAVKAAMTPPADDCPAQVQEAGDEHAQEAVYAGFLDYMIEKLKEN